MTFSIVARCAETGMFGIAVCSSSPAVAARCAFARAGVGAVASQNITDPSLGTLVLDHMESGLNARESIDRVILEARHIEYRQLIAVDSGGLAAVYTGKEVLGTWAETVFENVASAGNLLATGNVTAEIAEAFLSGSGHLGDRLVEALKAGRDAGGEKGPVHSAGMKIVDQVSWPVADLRCDWSDACPIEELARLWKLYQPQMDDYLKRAVNPEEAPAYGVPGDE